MCGGGGGGATITSPNYMQSTSEVMMQMEAMRSQREGVLGLAQTRLNAALNQQGQTLQELQQVKTQRANETSANAQRLAALVGVPAPDKTAQAPAVADNRAGQVRAQGKKQLRIDRTSSRRSGDGVGLNIT
jgi:hypothetical protein